VNGLRRMQDAQGAFGQLRRRDYAPPRWRCAKAGCFLHSVRRGPQTAAGTALGRARATAQRAALTQRTARHSRQAEARFAIGTSGPEGTRGLAGCEPRNISQYPGRLSASWRGRGCESGLGPVGAEDRCDPSHGASSSWVRRTS